MAKFSLKLGVGESSLSAVAETMWKNNGFDFLELYVPHDARPEYADIWGWYDGTLVLHAPHATGGFNFSKRKMAESNQAILQRVDILRRKLSPGMIIFHPGLGGDIMETFRQVDGMTDKYPELRRLMILENKPRMGPTDEFGLIPSPEEFRAAIERLECGFCFDVRHACAYAASASRDWRDVVAAFVELKPCLWHVADGLLTDTLDSHLHIYDGDMPWEFFAGLWSQQTLITVECKKDPVLCLQDFAQDIAKLREVSRTAKAKHPHALG